MWSELPRYPILLLFDVKLLCFYTTAGIEWKQLRGINNECASHTLGEENLHFDTELMCPSLLSPVSSLCSRSQSRTYPADRGETWEQPLQRAVLSLHKVSITRHLKISSAYQECARWRFHSSLNLRQVSLLTLLEAELTSGEVIPSERNIINISMPLYAAHRHSLFQVFDRVS